MVKTVALDVVLLIAVVLVGSSVYGFFGAAGAWLYVGVVLLLVWWVLGTSRERVDPDDEDATA